MLQGNVVAYGFISEVCKKKNRGFITDRICLCNSSISNVYICKNYSSYETFISSFFAACDQFVFVCLILKKVDTFGSNTENDNEEKDKNN